MQASSGKLDVVRNGPLLVVVFAILAFYCCEGLSQVSPQQSKGPVIVNLVRPEYYTASDFFADGQTSQAAALFETALSQSRLVGNQRGIDSVPPLVRLGECYWEQCDIGLALERYDAALQISIASQRWLTLLKPLTGIIRPETRPRELPWASNVRATQMGAFTEAWPIALGSSDQLLESSASSPVGAGKTISVDALEILRCQAIALRRRYQLLGQLTKYNPMTGPLLKTFSMNVAGQSEPIQVAMNICHALAAIGDGDRATAIPLLTKNLSMANGLDHPLTAIGLLALADLASETGDLMVAEERAVEASLVAARAGQLDHLYEAVETIAASGLANGREVGTAKMIQQIILWSVNKSRLVNIRGYVEAARLAALMGDLDTFQKQSAVATTLLLPKQVVMPRAEAAVRYAQSRAFFFEGNIADGINKLNEGVAYLRGNEKGIGSPTLFQLDLALQLTKSKAIPEATAEWLLGQLINAPAAGHWRFHPLEQLDWLMVDKSAASQLWLDIQLRNRDDAQMVGALDDDRRKRYRRFNELESRVFDLQMSLHGDSRFSGGVADAAGVRKQFPALDQNVSKIQQLIAPLLTNPKWDLRKWTEDETRRWENAIRLSASQESLLWSAAIGPVDVAEAFPPRHSQPMLTKSLRPTDAVVFFASTGTRMRGYLLESGKWQSWEISDWPSFEGKTTIWLEQMLALKHRDGATTDTSKSRDIAKRIEIRNQLFPAKIWAKLNSAQRWIIIPDGSLWNLPFEILPLSDLANSLPCISEHCITYSPTLGLVPHLMDAKPISKSQHGVDMHVNEFLSLDSSNAREIREDLAAKKRFIVDGSSKPSSVYPPSRFFKVASDCISAYSPMTWDMIGPMPTDQNSNQSHIRFWGRLPWGTPSTILLPGVNAFAPPPTQAAAPQTVLASQASGDEWLRLTLPLIAQGTRQLTISRWSVGGGSTVSLMRNFFDNQLDLSVSEAWQRSVLTLWEEQFEARNEPLFKNAKPDASVPGSQPLLWSGYLRIGDSK